MTTFKGRRLDLYQKLALLPAVAAGRVEGPGDMARSLWRAVGIEALSVIRESFVAKARGGADEAGITWKPLSAKYVAYQRRHPGLNRKRAYAAKAGRASRPLLSAAQDRLWRAVYARELARLRAKGSSDPSGSAAALAWALVKRAGGKTILGQYGNAPVEIGRDTGRLLASLSPGHPDSILTAERGVVTVGTNVTYAKHFHAKRPLWPERLPQAWQDRLAATFRDGLEGLARGLVEELVARGV